jgi:hypothetical protein
MSKDRVGLRKHLGQVQKWSLTLEKTTVLELNLVLQPQTTLTDWGLAKYTRRVKKVFGLHPFSAFSQYCYLQYALWA